MIPAAITGRGIVTSLIRISVSTRGVIRYCEIELKVVDARSIFDGMFARTLT